MKLTFNKFSFTAAKEYIIELLAFILGYNFPIIHSGNIIFQL